MLACVGWRHTVSRSNSSPTAPARVPPLPPCYPSLHILATPPQVAVFDTAFHQTMPPHAYMYGLPYDLYEKHKIRRYGFHGTSHKYLVEQAAGERVGGRWAG